MKVYSGDQPKVYSVSGQELRIHWDIQEVQVQNMDDQTESQWVANEALCHIKDSRSALIEKIIGSVHTPGAEIALINNKDTDPDAYAEYQAFRAKAKALANGWVNR